VLPLDRSSSIRSRPYVGTFDMLGGFAVRMEPRAGQIEERMKLKDHNNPALRRAGAEIFRESRKPIWLDAAKLASLGTSQAELDKAIESSDSKALAKICPQYFDPNGWFTGHRGCVNDPRGKLTVVPVEFIREVVKAKLARQPDSIDIGMSAGVGFSESESEDYSHSTSESVDVSTKAGLSVPLLNVLGLDLGVGVGASKGWSSSHGFSKGKSQSKSRGGDLGKGLTADEAEFKTNATVDRCVLITDKSEKKGAKVFMGCHSQLVPKTVTETYYFVYQHFSNSALLDVGASLEERPLLALIRGKARFENFRKFMQDPNMTLNLSKDLPAPADVMREAENRFDGYFPGLLTK
jgi:hypothetical protein